MSSQPKLEATLPALERALMHAAAARYPSRRPRARLGAPIALFVTLAVAGGAVAATGILAGEKQIETGSSASGPYAIGVKSAGPGTHAGQLCLQLEYVGQPPGYKCGSIPGPQRPFGLVVADARPPASDPDGPPSERVIYGLVSQDVDRVTALGSEAGERGTQAASRDGLPGRYFSIVVPNEGRIELIGYDSSGNEVGRVGSLSAPARRTEEGLIPAPGDPAVFAPTAKAP
jgi:hypothetical protein